MCDTTDKMFRSGFVIYEIVLRLTLEVFNRNDKVIMFGKRVFDKNVVSRKACVHVRNILSIKMLSPCTPINQSINEGHI